MPEPRVIILGAGPAGLGAAYRLHAAGRGVATVVERQDAVGGNSGSFEAGGQHLDFGSHRLHPSCAPEILADLQAMLGDDLLSRPRHGRIRLRAKWIHFPLKPLDLLLRLDRGFAAGTLRDMAFRRGGTNHAEETFASVLLASLGPTICEEFYFPYARKIWGRDPGELSAIQARKRVSAGSFLKLAQRVFSQLPGARKPMTGRFYYPRGGFGQISEAYADAARERGATVLLGWSAEAVIPPADGTPWRVDLAGPGGQRRTLEGDHVWSTLPVSLLARIHRGPAPAEVLAAANAIDYRAMLLIYLRLPVDRFTEYDAHYFPDAAIRITRLSEPKIYADVREPAGCTTLCAELPCGPGDPAWTASDEELAALVEADLARAGLPLPARPLAAFCRRLRFAYPIYTRGYEKPFGTLDAWAEGDSGVLTYGRQGLFAHDNTHHALAMAYAAVDCLVDGSFDRERWRACRREFERHVVED